MITSDGTRCVTCGSRAPEWVEADDYDGPEDFAAACAVWEAIHEECSHA